MTELEQAEQDVAAARVTERVAEWKAMEAKGHYHRYLGEQYQATAEVMGAMLRRDKARAAKFVDRAMSLSPDQSGLGSLEGPFANQQGTDEPLAVPSSLQRAEQEIGVKQNAAPVVPTGFTWWQSEPQTNPAPFPTEAKGKLVETIPCGGYVGHHGEIKCEDIDWEFVGAYRIIADSPSDEGKADGEPERDVVRIETQSPTGEVETEFQRETNDAISMTEKETV